MEISMSTMIEKPVGAAEMGESEIVAGAIADGSQGIGEGRLGCEAFHQSKNQESRLAPNNERFGNANPPSPAPVPRLVLNLHKRAPRIAPIAPLSPAHEINRQILEQILSTSE